MRFPLRDGALALISAFMLGAAASAGGTPVAADIRIEINAGRLTLEARDASLYEVIRRIGELAGFETTLLEDGAEPILVNVSLDNVSVLEALDHLIADANRIVVYAPSDDGSEARRVAHIWLLGSVDARGGDGVGQAQREASAGGLDHAQVKALNEAVLRLSDRPDSAQEKAQVLDSLTQVLQGAQDEIVRARAAVALGTLGDEGAVPALEAALLDEQAMVRSQAITALGQIGGERATAALGNILLYGSANRKERVRAAEALWKQDSEAARRYLRNGANDTDEQVRLASSKARSSTKGHIVAEDSDPEQNQ